MYGYSNYYSGLGYVSNYGSGGYSGYYGGANYTSGNYNPNSSGNYTITSGGSGSGIGSILNALTGGTKGTSGTATGTGVASTISSNPLLIGGLAIGAIVLLSGKKK